MLFIFINCVLYPIILTSMDCAPGRTLRVKLPSGPVVVKFEVLASFTVALCKGSLVLPSSNRALIGTDWAMACSRLMQPKKTSSSFLIIGLCFNCLIVRV